MKNSLSLFFVLFLSLIISNKARSQESVDEFEPVYMIVTTLHGVENVDMNAWKEVEKEFFDKVTSKNDLIISQEVLINYFSPSLSDVKLITVYKSWDDILDVTEYREELIAKAWPDEKERDAFFEKQNSFYTNFHSNNIYTSTKYSIPLNDDEKKSTTQPFIYYEQTNILADYDGKDSFEVYKEYFTNITKKNKYLRAYYSYRYYLGSDSREFIEMIVVNSLADLDKMLKKNDALLKKHIPDAAKRKEFLNKYRRAIASQKDNIYIIPTEFNVDCINGYPENNGVHPNTKGYNQIASTIYCWLKWQLFTNN